MTPHEFLDARMQLYLTWAGRETAGWRDAEQNEKLGGVRHSPHRFFLAVDFIPEPQERNTHLENDAKRLGLLALWQGDHYHLQPTDWLAG